MAFSAPSAKDFLLGMDSVHSSTKNLAKEALPPKFTYEQPASDRLVMVYKSNRKLCALMRGLILGAASHFGEKVELKESRCMVKGDTECRFEMRFSR
jgi:predicted hydrocarbon binding protein